MLATQDSQLIKDLAALSKKSPKLVRSSLYKAPNDPSVELRSWKCNEFKYYEIPSPFPTLARGLFSTEDKNEQRIVVRGYDKFFNIGEVPWTTWEALEEHTAGPYTLSLKSNGCIIFIAALSPDKLVVTSKHSLGPVSGVDLSHSQAGEQWLKKYLEAKGRTEVDLAARLWDKNWTAVAELCDDSFEEHVLAYPPERTGLHLHGLNVSTKDFITMPHDIVDAFAEEWGFIKTKTHTVNTIDEVRTFTNRIGEVGEWEGEAVEGFVVRTHVTTPPTEGSTAKRSGKSPYSPGSCFFFKVKFDEPYMMYRDWREVTKMLLSGKGISALPKGKMKRKETKLYVNWVSNEIKKNKSAFDGYTKGHGIIATRERFLQWLATEGTDAVVEEPTLKSSDGTKFEKAIIVPIAIPGCGKTSVSVALAHIFGLGHTQSDDVRAKKSAPIFLQNVVTLLDKHNVVIADKNNHLKQHRQQLRDAVSKFQPPVRLVALNWVLDKPPAFLHRICSERIISRGDKHQTLQADTSISRSHEDVIWMFINGFEELQNDEVDGGVEMELEDDLESMVRKSVDGIWKELGGPNGILGPEKPSEEKIREGLEKVGSYVPAIIKSGANGNGKSKNENAMSKKATKPPRYYGLLPEFDLQKLLNDVFSKPNTDEDGTQYYQTLKKGNRVTARPHITIVHSKALNESVNQQTVWDRSSDIQVLEHQPVFRCKLGKLLWDGRVMVITIDDVVLDKGGAGEKEGKKWLEELSEETRNRLHITVGTTNQSVPAVEGMTLVERWKKRENLNGIREVELELDGGEEGMWFNASLKGLFA